MIRDHTNDIETLTTLGADRLRMGIDEDGLVHVTDLLTNMYSDEEMAVLREYSTNARDSHVAAGQTRPIEVTLPVNSYEIASEERGHFLRIKDYGVGLSVEEIAEIYSRYGKSTKDQSNEMNGMMGIGGKSGLVDTFGSFKITAVKDGQQTLVMVGRDESGAPVMDLVSVTETDEPNGVEIELPTQRHSSLRRKAENLFKFWPEGSVLVDGVAPERLQPKVAIADTMWIVDGLYSKNQRSDFIVMGDVPYPCQLDGKLADGHSLVIFVPIGAVNFTPSREALRLTQKTKDETARLMAEYDQAVATVIQNAIDAAPTKAEAVKEAMKWRSAFVSNADLDVTYKGQKMPMRFKVEDHPGHKGIIVAKRGARKPSEHGRQNEIFIGTLVDAVLVHGYTGKNFVAVHKKKLEAWAKSKGLNPEHYVLTPKRLAHGWIDSSLRVDWEIVKAIKVTSGRQGSGGVTERPKGSYDMYLAGSYQEGVPADQIPLTEAVFWMDRDYFRSGKSRYGYRSRKDRSRQELMFERYPNATFVELTSNRVTKFTRDFPQARHASTILAEVMDALKAEVPKAHIVRRAMEAAYDGHTLRKLDVKRVDDPKVRKAIRVANKPYDQVLTDRIDKVRQVCGTLYNHDSHFDIEWKNPLDAYPLVDTNHLEHTYVYLNAAYAAQENK